jgi:hypothetical protein
MGNEQRKRNHGTGGTRAGRKGDPRMHRAVAARLAQPNLSLFDALKAGGFDYPTDDDAGILDSEAVTLAQRKNQLNRRVRLALTKKQEGNERFSPATGRRRSLSGYKHGLMDDEFSGDEESSTSVQEFQQQQQPKTRLAKYHPDYHPIVPPIAHPQSMSVLSNIHVSLDNNSNSLSSAAGLSLPPGVLPFQPITCSTSPKSVSNGNNAGNTAVGHGNPPIVASGVAVASLSQTAASVGMTLEQLAWTLQTHNTLSSVLLAGPTHFKTPKDLALVFYQNECRMLYQKCMLQAGFTADQVKEETKTHKDFASEAWQAEGRRLLELIPNKSSTAAVTIRQTLLRQGSMPAATTTAPQPLPPHKQNNPPVPSTAESSSSDDEQKQQARQQGQEQNNQQQQGSSQEGCSLLGSKSWQCLNHDHDTLVPGITDQPTTTPTNNTTMSEQTGAARHLHRLEGKCGHKAILHQPAHGTAHIDFLVGDRVECYQDVKPHASMNAQPPNWPSKYTCEGLSCNDAYCAEMAEENKLSSDYLSCFDPKIFYLDDITFDGKEWNQIFSQDETLVGLFKLADTCDPSE